MTLSPLLPLMFILRKDRAIVCPERLNKETTPRGFGAQNDEPNGAEKDGDGEMRGDTGLTVVVGGGVIVAVCRPICRFLSCLPLALASSLRLFYRSLRDASPSLPSSVLRSAPGVTPFPLVRK